MGFDDCQAIAERGYHEQAQFPGSRSIATRGKPVTKLLLVQQIYPICCNLVGLSPKRDVDLRIAMKTMTDFTKALMSMPMPWPLWLGLMVVVNGLAPIYFIGALEGKVVLATFMASAMIMIALFAAKGFVRLLGAGHILWVPMVLWLVGRLDQLEPGTALVYWLLGVIAINSISLVIDGIDVFRYMRGEREPTI